MKDIETKREREKKMISQMIALYCHRNHHTKGVLCPECAALNDYARARSEHCPFMETKTFCVNCRVHCYKPDMREKIRAVMRFSGPRMIFYHPVAAIRHVVETKREKRDWREKTDEAETPFLPGPRLRVPCARLRRHRAAGAAHGAVLPCDGVLLCKLVGKAAHMVSRHRALAEVNFIIGVEVIGQIQHRGTGVFLPVLTRLRHTGLVVV